MVLSRPSATSTTGADLHVVIPNDAQQWIKEKTGRGSGLDANYIGKPERGAVRWPHSDYRAGLREVLQFACDDELGFANTFLDWAQARRVRQHGAGNSAPR